MLLIKDSKYWLDKGPRKWNLYRLEIDSIIY